MSCTLKNGQINCFNPATGEAIESINITTENEFKQICDTAIITKSAWNSSSPGERIQIIRKFRKAIISRMDDFIETICGETGKKPFEGLLEVFTAAEHMKNAEKLTSKIFKKHKRKVGTLITKKAWVEYEAMGVAGIISPWNYPLILTLTPVVEALSAGNPVILKPSEQTPLTTVLLKEVWDESTGRPELLQTVYGGGEIGSMLVNSSATNVICFTGSTKIGKFIAADCAKHLKPVILELGGKDPMIICEDADIDRSVEAALWGGMSNAGQTCISVERIFVNEKIHNEFVEKLSVGVKSLRAGLNSDSDVGSISVSAGLDKIQAQIQNVGDSANVIQGNADNGNGLFHAPTIVIDPPPDSELAQQETFGPVVSVTSVKSDAEAVIYANNTGYGLSASVFSKNAWRAEKIASQVRAGSVTINDVMSHYGISDLPFGGVGLSGIGRVHGEEGIKAFCMQKSYMSNRINLGPELWWYSKYRKSEGLMRKFMKWYLG